ncbi:MAG: cytidylate kinase family protein [Clostridia bacterium]|nr:cytidylate kinase family protein [Clostridia bacterium]
MTEKNAKSCYGKISLAGDLGSGKSTVSKILIERLGATYYSTGAICRAIAAKHGMDIVEMNLYMETHPEIDTEIDDGLRALSDKDECMIIDSRMAWHFVRDTFKVYMTTELAESAKRILRAGRAEEQAETVEELAEKIRTRKASERKRYSEMYGVDCKDLSNYSLVVDSTYASPEEVAECILNCFADWQEDHSRTYAYVCPRRFLYPDAGTDEGRAAKLSELLDAGVDAGDAYAVECEGDIYLRDNAEVALAYAISDLPLVPTKLTVGKKPYGDFVKMTDTF